MKQFTTPLETLGNLKAEAAADLIAATSDLAVIIDSDGVIRDLAWGSDELTSEDCESWLGKPWQETVTIESREKIEDLLRSASNQENPRWRQVNHPSPHGADLPVLYSAMKVGSRGNVVAVGRNLRSVAVLQQRLVEAQQSVEREYARLRHAETRYRLLFQIASEPVLIVDASSRKVVEANPAAVDLLGKNVKKIVGAPFPQLPGGFDHTSEQVIEDLLTTVGAAGRGDEVRVQSADEGGEFFVTATLFRQEGSSSFLIRLAPIAADNAGAVVTKPKSRLIEIMEASPDGFVVTTPEGRILAANQAFLDLAQLAMEEQARKESLERWLGRPGVDWSVLRANLREHGSVRLFSTTLNGEYGSTAEVEISAVSVPHGDPPCFGFMIRNMGQRLNSVVTSGRELPRSVEQLTELVGRVSLKDIVRETADVIERLCIEAALELTGDNRASAAEMLGVSRQSLYVKLRRHGLADAEAETEH